MWKIIYGLATLKQGEEDPFQGTNKEEEKIENKEEEKKEEKKVKKKEEKVEEKKEEKSVEEIEKLDDKAPTVE